MLWRSEWMSSDNSNGVRAKDPTSIARTYTFGMSSVTQSQTEFKAVQSTNTSVLTSSRCRDISRATCFRGHEKSVRCASVLLCEASVLKAPYRTRPLEQRPRIAAASDQTKVASS